MGKTIFALTAFALALALFFFYTKPLYDSTGDIQADITQYDQALDKSTQLLQKKQQLMSRFNAFNPSDLDRLQKMLPDHVDNVALILDLDSLASRYGMGLENVDVSSDQSSGSGTDAASTIAVASTLKYESLTLRFSTRGTYTDFRQFLDSLQQSLRIVDITALTMSPDSDSTTNVAGAAAAASSEPYYKYDISLRTYWLK